MLASDTCTASVRTQSTEGPSHRAARRAPRDCYRET